MLSIHFMNTTFFGPEPGREIEINIEFQPECVYKMSVYKIDRVFCRKYRWIRQTSSIDQREMNVSWLEIVLWQGMHILLQKMMVVDCWLLRRLFQYKRDAHQCSQKRSFRSWSVFEFRLGMRKSLQEYCFCFFLAFSVILKAYYLIDWQTDHHGWHHPAANLYYLSSLERLESAF